MPWLSPANTVSSAYVLPLMPAQGRYGEGTEDSAATCLPVGTLLYTPAGWRPIETLSPGDTVWALDPVQMALTQAVVTRVEPPHPDQDLRRLVVGPVSVVLTAYHAVFVERIYPGWVSRRFVPVLELRAGDVLILANGKRVTVERVERVADVHTVLNIEVDPSHTVITEGHVVLHDATDPSWFEGILYG
jgi:hypothetical protein